MSDHQFFMLIAVFEFALLVVVIFLLCESLARHLMRIEIKVDRLLKSKPPESVEDSDV